MAEVGWGIGQIAEMKQIAPYYYLVNYGGSTFKGLYHITPGEFVGGTFQYDSGSKKGKRLPSGTKGINNPLHYIEKSQSFMDSEIVNILTKIKQGS